MSAQRTAFAYGTTSALPHARICGWCREAMSERDRHLMEQGAKVTHGICPACEAEHFPEEPRLTDTLICPACGEYWPYGEDECECGAYLTRTCDLCDRPIPETFGAALCHRCESTAKAHARLENDARRYPDPERRHAR